MIFTRSCLVLPVLFFWLPGCASHVEKVNNNINNTNNINSINNINNVNNINNINNVNNINNIEIIPANQNKTEAQALAQLFPGTTQETADTTSGSYFILKDEDGVVGYGITKTNYGFNGEVKTLLGISIEGMTRGVQTISEYESWWDMIHLGFFDQFSGISLDQVILQPGYDKNCSPQCDFLYDAVSGVDAVSGATYTSDAIIKNIMDGYLHHDEILSGKHPDGER